MSWKFSFFSSANSIKSSVKATQRNIILGDGFHRLKGLWHSKQTAAWRWVCGYKLHLSWVMWCMREGLVRKVPGLFYLSDCQPRAAAWEWVTRRNGPSSSKVIPLDVYTQGLLMFAFFFFLKKCILRQMDPIGLHPEISHHSPIFTRVHGTVQLSWKVEVL